MRTRDRGERDIHIRDVPPMAPADYNRGGGDMMRNGNSRGGVILGSHAPAFHGGGGGGGRMGDAGGGRGGGGGDFGGARGGPEYGMAYSNDSGRGGYPAMSGGRGDRERERERER